MFALFLQLMVIPFVELVLSFSCFLLHTPAAVATDADVCSIFRARSLVLSIASVVVMFQAFQCLASVAADMLLFCRVWC